MSSINAMKEVTEKIQVVDVSLILQAILEKSVFLSFCGTFR